MTEGAEQLELNMTIRNPAGDIVINDLELLRLIAKYKFLYNSRAWQFQDEDFVNWAWNAVTKGFQQFYKDVQPPVPAYKVVHLQRRWGELKDIIMTCNASNMLSAFPDDIAKVMLKLAKYLSNSGKKTRPLARRPSAGRLILERNATFIEHLPYDEQKKFEAALLQTLHTARPQIQPSVKERSAFAANEKTLLLALHKLKLAYEERKKKIRRRAIPPGIAPRKPLNAKSQLPLPPLFPLPPTSSAPSAPSAPSINDGDLSEDDYMPPECFVQATLGGSPSPVVEPVAAQQAELPAPSDAHTSALFQMPFLMDFLTPETQKAPLRTRKRGTKLKEPKELGTLPPTAEEPNNATPIVTNNKRPKVDAVTTARGATTPVVLTAPLVTVPLKEVANLGLKKLRVRLQRIDVEKHLATQRTQNGNVT